MSPWYPILLLALLSSGPAGEQTIRLEQTVFTKVVKVDERREHEDRYITAEGGTVLSAAVVVYYRWEWREFRLLVTLEPTKNNRLSMLPKRHKSALKESLSSCLESENVKDTLGPMEVGVEMWIAPLPGKTEEFADALRNCFQPKIPEILEIKLIDYEINTSNLGWRNSEWRPPQGP